MTVEAALAQIGSVVQRAPFGYASSYPLEHVVVSCPTERLELLLKRQHEHESGGRRSLERETAAYLLLGGAAPGIPLLFGWGPGWLLLEHVAAPPLWQHGELDAWRAAAGWAAQLHQRFARQPPSSSLVRYDGDLYLDWFAMARERHPEAAALGDAVAAAASRLAAMPQTLIHGELYASNALVGGGRVAVVDWETAGFGPGVLDLAALVVGWDPGSRGEIVGAYNPNTDPADLAAAELVLALRCLGLPPAWEPPPEHRRDWLSEAWASAKMLT